MKIYKTDQSIEIFVRVIPDTKLCGRPISNGQILNTQFNRDDEREILLPASMWKKQFNANAFAKHILNFFIKD